MSRDPIFAEVHTDGQKLYLPLDEIARRVAWGQIGLDAHLICPQLYGNDPKPIWMIDILMEAGDTPEARIMDHLRRYATPWGAMTLLLWLGILGILQQRGWFTAGHLAVGWSAISIHKEWWTPWTYWWVHLDWMHWLGNCILVYFCAVRVERIVGIGSFWASVSWMLLGSACTIWSSESGAVVGASPLVFGLWAMQVGLGFRYAHNLPAPVQAHYGWGNFLVFVPMLMLNLYQEDVSHIAHWTAMIIGGALSVWMQPESSMRVVRSGQRWIRLGGLHTIGIVTFWTLANQPLDLSQRLQTEAGFNVAVPSELHPASWCGVRTWEAEGLRLYSAGEWLMDTTIPAEQMVENALFACGVEQTRCSIQGERRIVLQSSLQQSVQANWTVIQCTAQERKFVEQVVLRGRLLLRVGCEVSDSVTEALCQEWLITVQLGETEAERAAYRKWHREDQTGRAFMDYADELLRYGRIDEADQLLATMQARFDDYRWRGIEHRLRLHLHHQPLHDSEWIDERVWLTSISRSIPVDETMVLQLFITLATERGFCAEAVSAWQRWRQWVPTGLDSLQLRVEQCGGNPED